LSVEFTPREEDVARCIRECLSNKEIAERLDMSRSSVIFHLSNMYRKIGLEGEAKGSRMLLLRWLMNKEIMDGAVRDAQEHYVGAR
jgi:DNA-binding NarL/FixJ family response regulator